MAIAVSDIQLLLARFGNKVINEQVNLNAPILNHLVRKQTVGAGFQSLNLIDSGNSSVGGHQGGGAAVSAGGSSNYAPISVTPVNFYGRLALPTDSLAVANGSQDGLNLIKTQMESVAAAGLRVIGRTIFDFDLGGATAVSISGAGTYTAGETITITCRDAAGFRPGMSVDVWETTDNFVANGTFKARVVLTSVGIPTNSGANTGQATVIGTIQSGDAASAVPAPAGGAVTLANVRFVIKAMRGQISGTSVSGFAPIGGSFASLLKAAGTGNLYNTAVAGSFDYSGNLDTSSTALTNATLVQLYQSAAYRGVAPSHLVLNDIGYGALANASLLTSSTTSAGGQRRFVEGEKIDVYGKDAAMMFMGRPVVADPNCPIKAVVFFNDQDYQLWEAKRWGPIEDGKGNIQAPSQSSLSMDFQYLGMYNALVRRRNGIAAIAGGLNAAGGLVF